MRLACSNGPIFVQAITQQETESTASMSTAIGHKPAELAAFLIVPYSNSC